MQFYFGIVVLSSIAIFESLSLIHLSHHTTLHCIIFLFYVRCQDTCLHGYSVATMYGSNGPLPMQSAVYLSIN